MGEECHLCKMEVSSLQLHWKINHKNVKRSVLKKKKQIGFNQKQKRSVVSGAETGGNKPENKLATCPECGAKDLENLDQHILLQHRIQAEDRLEIDKRNKTRQEVQAEMVKKKLQAFRTQRKFDSTFSEKDIVSMRRKGEERLRLYRNIVSGICADNSTPQLVVCPFCSKTLFYGILQSRNTSEKIKGPVKKHLVNCDPDLKRELASVRRNNKAAKCQQCHPNRSSKVKTEEGENSNHPSVVYIDGVCTHGAKYSKVDALGNPLDQTLVHGFDRYQTKIPGSIIVEDNKYNLTIEKTELDLEEEQHQMQMPALKINEELDCKASLEAAEFVEVKCEGSSCDTLETDDDNTEQLIVISSATSELTTETDICNTPEKKKSKKMGGLRLVAIKTDWKPTENIQSFEEDS